VNLKEQMTYIITETKGADSFDPLNADKTQNLFVMRMLYATPIEVNASNELSSKVLSEFSYDPKTYQITMILNENLNYLDGTAITVDDLVFSIVRMAVNRPKFPVIKNIKGLQEWMKQSNPLLNYPQGIQVNGNKVTITLSQPSANPLFRFCLELFSIIPKSCVDLNSGKLTCSMPPASGNFSILKKTESEIVFTKRIDTVFSEPIKYEKIVFRYQTLEDSCKNKLNDAEVIAANELDFLNSKCANFIKTENIYWTPSSRFGILRFNPNVEPFQDNVARQYFSELVRVELKNRVPNLLVERGLFSSLLPGYISSDQFMTTVDSKVQLQFKNRHLTIPRNPIPGFKCIYEAIKSVASDLSMNIIYSDESSTSKVTELFLSGRISIVVGASGFWAQDPVGDISMWFTPNLHPTMTFAWNDSEIYRQISSLESETDLKILKEKLQIFNKYISMKSVLIPIVHFRRLYISNSIRKSDLIPQAVTSPAPWQFLVDMEK